MFTVNGTTIYFQGTKGQSHKYVECYGPVQDVLNRLNASMNRRGSVAFDMRKAVLDYVATKRYVHVNDIAEHIIKSNDLPFNKISSVTVTVSKLSKEGKLTRIAPGMYQLSEVVYQEYQESEQEDDTTEQHQYEADDQHDTDHVDDEADHVVTPKSRYAGRKKAA